jgi:hypothetical protein
MRSKFQHNAGEVKISSTYPLYVFWTEIKTPARYWTSFKGCKNLCQYYVKERLFTSIFYVTVPEKCKI